jgi:6-phosphogluconolactonase (cycloisomerase 2 family)
MRMKLNKSSQLLLVSAASLLAAGLVTACGTLTTDFVFVASSKAAGPNNYGEMDVFEINSESGFMRQIPTSPFPSGGRNPVAEAVSADQTNLFVVNHDDNTIVQFVIGNDGKLYPENTVNTPGIFPMAIAVSGSNLFVVDTYQPLASCSTAAPCSGSIGVFPVIAQSGSTPSSLGTPVTNTSLSSSYWPLNLPSNPSHVIVPTALNVLASGAYVYVTAYDASVKPSAGYVFGFAVGAGGALAPLNNGVPFAAGTQPSAIASFTDSNSNSYVYVTDLLNANVDGFAVQSGLLTPLSGSPFAAGNQPSAIVVDPKYPFAYVANSLDSTVNAYSLSNGALSPLGAYATGAQPVAIGIDPSTSHFLFTANYLGNSVSGFQLSTTDGTLVNSQDSPYRANAQPTAVAAISHNTPSTKP